MKRKGGRQGGRKREREKEQGGGGRERERTNEIIIFITSNESVQ